jgi:hypothetical protein
MTAPDTILVRVRAGDGSPGEPAGAPPPMEGDQARPEALFGRSKAKDVAIKVEDLAGSLQSVSHAFERVAVVHDAQAQGGFHVDSFTVKFTVTAKGTVVVAEAGVEASIEVTFKRSP